MIRAIARWLWPSDGLAAMVEAHREATDRLCTEVQSLTRFLRGAANG